MLDVIYYEKIAGVHLDRKFTWNVRIDSVCTKLLSSGMPWDPKPNTAQLMDTQEGVWWPNLATPFLQGSFEVCLRNEHIFESVQASEESDSNYHID